MKKLVLLANRLNHYQKSISDEFAKIYGNDYTYIAMLPFFSGQPVPGVRDLNYEPYVLRGYESPGAMQEARNLIDGAECVIIGGSPEYMHMTKGRLSRGKMTFLYSERFFKGPLWKDAVRFMKYYGCFGTRSYSRDIRSKFYLLCTSAFAAWDYNTCGLFRNKAYRWGYFPEAKRYDDIDGLISRKKKAGILWAGRYIGWKHPELAVKLASNLRDRGLSFTLRITGSGVMESELQRLVESSGLNDCISLNIGRIVQPDEIRSEMENAQIFIFTSDRGEGWGVVLNEAMNSGCAVVAGEKIGAAPYLIDDGQNGLIFRDRDIDDLTEKVAGLLREPERMRVLGRNAYETVTGLWSPKSAAERFVRLADALRESEGAVSLWEYGPGSVAPVI